jgi:multicomponent Na+:H+ antiporter subunit F
MIMMTVVLAILGVSALMAVYRLIRSAETSSKVVVLDVITTLTTGVLVIFSALFDTPFLLDIAVVYAILSFAAVLLVSRYLERSI